VQPQPPSLCPPTLSARGCGAGCCLSNVPLTCHAPTRTGSERVHMRAPQADTGAAGTALGRKAPVEEARRQPQRQCRPCDSPCPLLQLALPREGHIIGTDHRAWVVAPARARVRWVSLTPQSPSSLIQANRWKGGWPPSRGCTPAQPSTKTGWWEAWASEGFRTTIQWQQTTGGTLLVAGQPTAAQGAPQAAPCASSTSC